MGDPGRTLAIIEGFFHGFAGRAQGGAQAFDAGGSRIRTGFSGTE